MKNEGNSYILEPNKIPVGWRKSVTPKHVLMLVADINYTTIHLCNGEQFIIATTLKRVQQSLDSYGSFVRTNKKIVVNFDYVLSHSEKQLTLPNNQIVSFSRRQRRLFMKRMAK